MERNKAKIISMINYKGGVGKTTSTFNIGVGLSLFNAKVLLIDLDPQCSLSQICLRSLGRSRFTEEGRSRSTEENINLSELPRDETINQIIENYLIIKEGENPNIDLTKFIKSFNIESTDEIVKMVHQIIEENKNINLNNITMNFNIRNSNKMDFIPATMFDGKKKTGYQKGLDDLEIEISRKYSKEISYIDLITIFTKFLIHTKVNEMYDFIIFDCPPANSIITQNALAISDFYLVPTIMDDMSSNGINHLKNLIECSIFNNLYESNKSIIDNAVPGSPYYYLKNKPQLLGIFETLRKSQIKDNNRQIIEGRFKDEVFESTIYHHKYTGEATSKGIPCFSPYDDSIHSIVAKFSPDINYMKLTLEILNRINSIDNKRSII